MCNEDIFYNEAQERSLADKFSKLFSGLERCPESEQKRKIEEMNLMVEEMNKEEFKSIFTKELYDRISKMIEKKKITTNNALVLLKQVGYFNVLKTIWGSGFHYSELNNRVEKMIAEENEKKEEKNEKLLVDLCECFLFLSCKFSKELLSICEPCLLKVTLRKEENNEAQKEVEIALLALSCVHGDHPIEQKLYLNEIKEIIKYHQDYRCLTCLSYESAWEYLTQKFNDSKFKGSFFVDEWRRAREESLEEVILNELHFAREATRELEELMKFVDWKREKEEERRGKEVKEVLVTRRWLHTLWIFFRNFRFWKEEFAELIGIIVRVYRASRINCKVINCQCIRLFEAVTGDRDATIEDLLKSGIVSFFLEELQQSTIKSSMTCQSLTFCFSISKKLKEKNKDEMEEAKRKKLKRKVFEKLEEKGYEDCIIGLCHYIIHGSFGDCHLIENCSEYFVYP
ncbi:uncharacterized protein MONOS_18019 [Monocercomonoides exilis]|uniref:uncharacterized protein n=1 Tax=Monocercomonoides exilis TaxID=2049356 RepID=UPI00355A9DEF|nr:hypothetical protein MONOS_18019 [Monocercomonoides exilis]